MLWRQEEVQALQVEIEQLEAELARTGRKEELTAPQNELLTYHAPSRPPSSSPSLDLCAI